MSLRRISNGFVVFLLSIIVISTFPVMNKTLACHKEPSFFYVGRDSTTQGNWTEHGYGDCGYALPYAEVKGKENAIGETTCIGETVCSCDKCEDKCDYRCDDKCYDSSASACAFWWREPWSIQGENYTYPYEDYLGGKNILEYEITGPRGPPRALVNASNDYYRPSWYCHDSLITVTLKAIPLGNYNLSIYLLDWDAPFLYRHRKLEVNVTSGGSWGMATFGNPLNHDNFAAGIYAIFEVEVTDGIIVIEVESLWGKTNAVVSGIFLDEIFGPVSGVSFVGIDRETIGNWRPSYGNDYYLLAGFNVPISNVTYIPVDKTYDETNLGDYEVSDGVCQYAADDSETYGVYPYIGQYAAYAWTLPLAKTASDPRVLIYPEDRIFYGYPPTPMNERIYGQWDCGEFVGPLNYLTIKLEIPERKSVLSVYAMDWARHGRSETIEIWDESMTTLLDSQHITGDEINEGIYVQWFVEGPRIINIKVIADPGNLNSFIDGIFLNCMSCRCCYDGKTIGFWKCNVWKALRGAKKGFQVSKEGILEALGTITELYGTGSTWDFDWLTFDGSDDEKLGQALATLRFWTQGGSMQAKARAHILALLLTDTHFARAHTRKHFCTVWIWWYEGGETRTITGWITTILNAYKDGNYETAKNLARYLNEK